jgi:hypothetical protein
MWSGAMPERNGPHVFAPTCTSDIIVGFLASHHTGSSRHSSCMGSTARSHVLSHQLLGKLHYVGYGRVQLPLCGQRFMPDLGRSACILGYIMWVECLHHYRLTLESRAHSTAVSMRLEPLAVGAIRAPFGRPRMRYLRLIFWSRQCKQVS